MNFGRCRRKAVRAGIEPSTRRGHRRWVIERRISSLTASQPARPPRMAQSPSCRACRTRGRRLVDERAPLPREVIVPRPNVPPSALRGRGRPVVPVSGRQLSNRLPRYALRGSGSRRRSCIGGTDPNGCGPPQLPPLHGGIELYECHYGPEPDDRHGAKVPSSGDLGPHSRATGLSVTRQAPHRSPLYRRP